MLCRLFVGSLLFLFPTIVFSQTETKTDYVDAVVRGAGLMPWQKPGVSEEEKEFREHIEARKTRMLQNRDRVEHPALLSKEAIERIRRKREEDPSVESWAQSSINFANTVIEKGEGYIEEMIPELTPTNPYGFTCPHCVGKQSQEGVGSRIVGWSHESPEQIFCRTCGQTYPDEKYPETIELKAPRSGQTFTYYVNEKQRANPENKTGELAYHWVGYPVHISFTGIVRGKKILHLKSALNALAYAYLFTEEVKYAEKTKEILLRFAECYPNWLYHDYWDTIADCDPMYAAWHDKSLPIEWKRHLSTNAYRNDTMEKAGMLQTYWGCGRIHPSTDGISGLDRICEAYDLVVTATYPDGSPVWSDEEKTKVERDFILEYVIGGEPFVGGEGKADEENNKAPRVYHAQAAVAMCLGIPELADVAIRGYEVVRDNSFLYDGMSTESPSYTNMYLSQLIAIPEKLYGFEWPSDFEAREGVYDPYADDWRLELMYRAVLDQLDPEYRLPSTIRHPCRQWTESSHHRVCPQEVSRNTSKGSIAALTGWRSTRSLRDVQSGHGRIGEGKSLSNSRRSISPLG